MAKSAAQLLYGPVLVRYETSLCRKENFGENETFCFTYF